MRFIRRHEIGAACLFLAALLVTVLCYHLGIRGPFIFDDMPNIGRLELLQGELTRSSLGYYLSSFPGNPGRPLAALSFLIDDYAWPSSPEGFKRTNLALHLLCGTMVFGFVRSVAIAYGSAGARGHDWTQARANWIAALASAMWLLHPIHVSALLLTVQRMTILSALFVVAGLWAYVASVRTARTAIDHLASTVYLGLFTVLAFASKENGALAPLYALVLNVTVLRDVLATRTIAQKRVVSGTLVVAAMAPFVAILLTPGTMDFTSRDYSLYERLSTQLNVLTDYAAGLLLPQISGGASIYHDDYPISRGLASWPTFGSALLLAGALIGSLAARRSLPWLALPFLWYLAGHAMESSFVSLELYFEHRNYLPSLGLMSALAFAVVQTSGKLRAVVVPAALAWTALLAAITFQHAKLWGDERLLAATWVAEHPRSSRAAQLQAKVLAENKRWGEARSIFERAGGRTPLDNAPLYLILIDCELGGQPRQVDVSDALELLEAGTLNVGTQGLIQQIRQSTQEGKCASFGRPGWLRLTDAWLKNQKGAPKAFAHYERALLHRSEGNLDRTLAELEAAYAADPSVDIANAIASTLSSSGHYSEALAWVDTANRTKIPRFKAWLRQLEKNQDQLRKSILEEQQNAESAPLLSPPERKQAHHRNREKTLGSSNR